MRRRLPEPAMLCISTFKRCKVHAKIVTLRHYVDYTYLAIPGGLCRGPRDTKNHDIHVASRPPGAVVTGRSVVLAVAAASPHEARLPRAPLYDLIIRDATIVSSRGRLVADVAIEEGRIAYIGPRPPKRRTQNEVSAMGRFLAPGVIDTAVQFEPNGDSASWEHESRAALSGGVTTVLALPGGDRPVVDSASARARIDRVGASSWVHYALWGAALADNAPQLAQARQSGLVRAALGRLAVDDGDGLPTTKVVAHASTPGVLGVQLSALLERRPEVEQFLTDLLAHAAQPHVVHLSTAEELQILDPVRGESRATTGVTPHHLFFSTDDDGADQVRTSPPVRPELDRRSLWTAVKRGRLDCVASDHYPSRPGENAGVPGSELLLPLLLSAVRQGRMTLELLVALCAERPAEIFGLSGKGRVEKGFDADLVLFTEGEADKVDAGQLLSASGWSPYAAREAAPKPEMVILNGRIVARRGRIVSENPQGSWLGPANS